MYLERSNGIHILHIRSCNNMAASCFVQWSRPRCPPPPLLPPRQHRHGRHLGGRSPAWSRSPSAVRAVPGICFMICFVFLIILISEADLGLQPHTIVLKHRGKYEQAAATCHLEHLETWPYWAALFILIILYYVLKSVSTYFNLFS